MKNLSISIKLALISVPAFAALVILSFLFVANLRWVNDNTNRTLYDDLFVPEAALLNADRDFYQAYVAENELTILREQNKMQGAAGTSEELANDFNENVKQVEERVTSAFNSIRANTELYSVFKHPTAGVTLQELENQFFSDFNSWCETADPAKGAKSPEEHLAMFSAARENINLMTELFEAYAEQSSAKMKEDIIELSNELLIIVVIVSAFMIMVSVYVILYIRRNLLYISKISKRIAQGELRLEIDKKRYSKDEIGQLSQAMGQILVRLAEYSCYIDEITRSLSTMEKGDMRINLTYAYEGEFSSIKKALLGISDMLNRTLSTINTAANYVSLGSSQVSDGAQALASGAAEQSSTIQQLNVSAKIVAQQAAESYTNIKTAVQYVEEASINANKSDEHMAQLTAAMSDIGTAS